MDKKRKVSRIEVDKNACIGCGTCAVLSPKAFELGEEGYSKVLNSWNEISDEELNNTAKSCPNGAIILFDQEGNKLNI